MTEDASLEGRVSPKLLAALSAARQGTVEILQPSLVADFVRLLLDKRVWGTPLGVHLPGLLTCAGDAIPDTSLSSRARNALGRLEVETCGDLARVTPREIMELRMIGARTLSDVVEVAVVKALSAAPSPNGAGPIADDEVASASRIEEGPQKAVREVGTALEKLATWAERESAAATVGELLVALTSDTDVPSDVREAWESIASTKVSAVAHHPMGQESLLQLLERLLGAMEDRQRIVFIARCLSPNPPTLQQLADQLGVTRERVRQLQGRAETRVADLLKEERFAPLRWRAHTVRSQLAAVVPKDGGALLAALADASGPDASDRQLLLSRLLLRLAGYSEREGWMIRDDAALIGAAVLEEAANEYGLIDADRVNELLTAAGVASEDHAALLARIGAFRRFGDVIAVWKGSVADKAVRVLAVMGRPATPDELAKLIGEGHTERSLRQRLYDDPRLMRVSKNTWALRAWGLEEYTGVADAIAEEIERQGGRAPLAHLVEVLTSRFGIAEASVRTYSQTPRFVVEDGTVRVRRDDEPYRASASIADAKGCFQDSPTSVTLCVRVDSEVLRGSGRPLPVGIAVFLGLVPGGEIRLQPDLESGERASIVLTWPADSVVGPTLGSIRLFAVREGADEGDLLRLRFDRAERTVHATRITASVLTAAPALDQLSLITGLELGSTNAVDALAESLGVDARSIHRILHARGDADLARLLPQPAVSADLDAALAELEAALLRNE